MISSKTYINWIRDLTEANLYMIAVGYNPDEKKRILKQGGFDIDNPIIDIPFFSEYFSRIVEKYIGNSFKVRLIDTKYSFLPDFFPRSNSDVILMKKYLDKISWQKKKYFGEFTIDNLQGFLTVFINYSLNHNYQDILLTSFEKDVVIQISHHGDIWITSASKDLIKQIGNKLDKEGATVIYGNSWKTV